MVAAPYTITQISSAPARYHLLTATRRAGVESSRASSPPRPAPHLRPAAPPARAQTRRAPHAALRRARASRSASCSEGRSSPASISQIVAGAQPTRRPSSSLVNRAPADARVSARQMQRSARPYRPPGVVWPSISAMHKLYHFLKGETRTAELLFEQKNNGIRFPTSNKPPVIARHALTHGRPARCLPPSQEAENSRRCRLGSTSMTEAIRQIYWNVGEGFAPLALYLSAIAALAVMTWGSCATSAAGAAANPTCVSTSCRRA